MIFVNNSDCLSLFAVARYYVNFSSGLVPDCSASVLSDEYLEDRKLTLYKSADED